VPITTKDSIEYVGFIPLLFILQFTAMAFGLVIVFKRKDRKKPLHALIHEKSFPGTCSEHNTIFAPGSAIATLDEGQRPILDVNLPHSYFSFAPGPTTDFPFNPAQPMSNFNPEYPIYNFNPAQPMSHQFLELLYDCWGRPYYNVCDYPLGLEEKSRDEPLVVVDVIYVLRLHGTCCIPLELVIASPVFCL
jgi:hypothetical protein